MTQTWNTFKQQWKYMKHIYIYIYIYIYRHNVKQMKTYNNMLNNKIHMNNKHEQMWKTLWTNKSIWKARTLMKK